MTRVPSEDQPRRPLTDLSSLGILWIANDNRLLQAVSKDSDRIVNAQADLNLCLDAHVILCEVLLCANSNRFNY